MNSLFDNEEARFFFSAILSLKTMEEVADFFEDTCTVNEILAMGQRLYVAKHLVEGSTYAKIKEKTGASSATISRVKRTLLYGKGAYKRAIERI